MRQAATDAAIVQDAVTNAPPASFVAAVDAGRYRPASDGERWIRVASACTKATGVLGQAQIGPVMRQLEQYFATRVGATVHYVVPAGRQRRQYVYRGQSLESLLRRNPPA